MVEKQKHYYEIIIRRFRRPKLERDGVVICGAYGKGNGGDNAILDAIVAQLRHIDPDLPICALSRTPKETRAAACVDSLYTFRLLAIRRRMRHAKLYLSGGGTLIQDTTSTRSLLYYLSSIRMARPRGLPRHALWLRRRPRLAPAQLRTHRQNAQPLCRDHLPARPLLRGDASRPRRDDAGDPPDGGPRPADRSGRYARPSAASCTAAAWQKARATPCSLCARGRTSTVTSPPLQTRRNTPTGSTA